MKLLHQAEQALEGAGSFAEIGQRLNELEEVGGLDDGDDVIDEGDGGVHRRTFRVALERYPRVLSGLLTMATPVPV